MLLYKRKNNAPGKTPSEPVFVVAPSMGVSRVADQSDVKNGTPLRLYQVMIFDTHSHILIQGLVGSDKSDVYLPEFKEMVRILCRN